MTFNVRKEVKKFYGNLAKQKTSCCCKEISRAERNYEGEFLENIPEDAIKTSLGCANPLIFAELKEGEKVLDLGSGGGIDVLMSSKFVGKTGKIYGLDMTDEMLELSNRNKEKMGVTNVEFIKGY